jgi:cell division protein FtsB
VTGSDSDEAKPRRSGISWRRAVWPLLAVATVLAVLFYAVFPTRTWLDQRSEASALEAEIEELTEANSMLITDIARLQTDAEIERIARRDLSLVYPGEEAYARLPSPPAPISVPGTWPFTILGDALTS